MPPSLITGAPPGSTSRDPRRLRGLEQQRHHRRRVGEGRHPRRAVALLERLQHLLGRDRDFVDAHADRVGSALATAGITGRSGPCPPPSRRTGPSGSSVSTRIDSTRRHLERRRAPVFEQRRDLVEARAEDLLLHERLAEAHVGAALDLAVTSSGLIARPSRARPRPSPRGRAGLDVDRPRRPHAE